MWGSTSSSCSCRCRCCCWHSLALVQQGNPAASGYNSGRDNIAATLHATHLHTHTHTHTQATLSESIHSASWSGFCTVVAQSSVFAFGSFAGSPLFFIFPYLFFCSSFQSFCPCSCLHMLRSRVVLVLPYILNMLVRPVDQMAMLRPGIAPCGGVQRRRRRGGAGQAKRQLNAKAGSKNHLATKRVIYASTMIRAGKVPTEVAG